MITSRYSLYNNNNFNIYNNTVKIDLTGEETFEVEPKAFIAGSNIICKTKQATTGFFNSLMRLLSNESFFTNTFTKCVEGPSWFTVGSPDVAQIASYKLSSTDEKIYILKGCFMASTSNVKLTTPAGSLTDIAQLTDPESEGEVLFHSERGTIDSFELSFDHPIMVDCKHLLAYSTTDKEITPKFKNISSGIVGYAASGEDGVWELSGQGRVFVQSHAKLPPVENKS